MDFLVNIHIKFIFCYKIQYWDKDIRHLQHKSCYLTSFLESYGISFCLDWFDKSQGSEFPSICFEELAVEFDPLET